jgi:hypothetical protein
MAMAYAVMLVWYGYADAVRMVMAYAVMRMSMGIVCRISHGYADAVRMATEYAVMRMSMGIAHRTSHGYAGCGHGMHPPPTAPCFLPCFAWITPSCGMSHAP